MNEVNNDELSMMNGECKHSSEQTQRSQLNIPFASARNSTSKLRSKMVKEKTLIPILRFREFNKNWNSSKGSEITDKITKGSSPKWQGYQYQKTGVLFITSENVRDGFIDISKPKYLPKEFFDTQTSSHLKLDDILINIVGASIGRCAQFTLNCPSFTNQAVALFRVNSCQSPKFIAYAYQEERIQRIIAGGQSDSARPNLSLTDLRELKFHIPSLPEQEKIAAFLTSVDDRIEQLKRKKTLLQSFKKACMQRLFSNVQCSMMNDQCSDSQPIHHSSLITNHSLRFRQDNGEPYPDWEEKKLGEICSTFKSGKSITSARIKIEGTYPVYGGNGLRGYTENFTHEGFYILIGRQGALCGNINRVTEKSFISEHAIAVQADSNSNTEWLAQLLTHMNLNRFSESSAQPGLSVNKLVKFKVFTPSLNEQTKIAEFLSNLDMKIDHVEQQVKNVEIYKKGLLQQMFI